MKKKGGPELKRKKKKASFTVHKATSSFLGFLE
jgi:hypothetical protein